jgi:hypothetical protein
LGTPHGGHIGTLLEQRENEKNLPLPPPTKLKRKPVGNTLGTCWNKEKMKKIFFSLPKLKRKPMGNTLGTCWNKEKMKKDFLPHKT